MSYSAIFSAILLRRSSPMVRFQARFHGGSDKPRDYGYGNAVQKPGEDEKRMTRNRAILSFIKEMKIDAVIGDDIPPGVHKLQFHTKEEFDKLTTILSSKDLPQKFGLEDPKARVHEILLDYATKIAIVDSSGEILSNLSKFLRERYFEKKATAVSVSDILSQLNVALKMINEKVENEKGAGSASAKEEKKEGSTKEEKKEEESAKEEKKEESANEEKKQGSANEEENGKSKAEGSGSEDEDDDDDDDGDDDGSLIITVVKVACRWIKKK